MMWRIIIREKQIQTSRGISTLGVTMEIHQTVELKMTNDIVVIKPDLKIIYMIFNMATSDEQLKKLYDLKTP